MFSVDEPPYSPTMFTDGQNIFTLYLLERRSGPCPGPVLSLVPHRRTEHVPVPGRRRPSYSEVPVGRKVRDGPEV